MDYDDPLRIRARTAIESGRMPTRHPARSWAGKGSGGSCLLCSGVITPDDVEIELEFVDASPTVAPLTCRVHSRCFTAWELECRQLATGS